MAVIESQIREEVVYVAGRDLADAVHNMQLGANTYDTPQEAYNNVGYFDLQDFTYEVFKFETVTRVNKVDPPYTKR